MNILKLTTHMVGKCFVGTAIVFILGCGGGGNESSVENENVNNDEVIEEVAKNNLAGTWLISKEDTVSYWIFSEDGTFQKKRAGESLNSPNHFVGRYSIVDGQISGEFRNPGVGTGDIEGVIAPDGRFLMDFIEYWHTPPKVVPCVGIRQ